MLSRTVTENGVIEERSFDSDGSLLIKRMQNVTPFLDHNAYLRNHVDWRGERDPGQPDFRLGAIIPNMVIEEWLKKGVNAFNPRHIPKIRELLNGEYKYLKTFPGRL
jgi:hypothetical protein